MPSEPVAYVDLCVCASVRLSVCLSVCQHTFLKNHTSELHHQILRMLPVAVARSSSGGVAIRYVLPVLWMTLWIMGFMLRGNVMGKMSTDETATMCVALS